MLSVKKCSHHEAKLVWDGLWAGAGMARCVVPDVPGLTILDLAGYYEPEITQYGCSLPLGHKTPILRMRWNDRGVPYVSSYDWSIIANNVGPLFIACAGGHGRTGTALAILGSLRGHIPAHEEAVAFTRAAYCDEAIETNGQITYIRDMTGHHVVLDPVVALPAAKQGDLQWGLTDGGAGRPPFRFTKGSSVYDLHDLCEAVSYFTPKDAKGGMCASEHVCNKKFGHKGNHECDAPTCKLQWQRERVS